MGREQLALLALIIFIALFDLVSRRARARRSEPEPAYPQEEPVYDDQPVYDEEPAYDDEPVFTVEDEREWLRSERAEAEPPPTRTPAARLRRAPVTPVHSAIRSPRRSHWLRQPANARKAIVMMTVLGRCRGLD